MISYLLPFALLQTSSVTVTTVPMGPIKTVFARMSPLLPKPVFASPILAKEPLFVHVKGVSFADLRSKIALAMNAVWEEKPEGWWLVRTKANTDKDIKAFRDKRLADFTTIVKRRQELDKKYKPFDAKAAADLARRLEEQTKREKARGDGGTTDDDQSVQMAIADEEPEGRFMSAVLARLNPADFVDLPTGTYTVYSPTPTRRQRKLRGDVMPFVREYVRQQNLWLGTLAKTSIAGARQNPDGLQTLDDPDSMRFFLEVQVESWEVEFRVALIDRAGRKVLENSASDFWDGNKDETRDELNERWKLEKEFKATPLTMFFADALRNRAKFDEKSEGYLKQIAEVEKMDPLELAASESLRAYAEQEQKNVVVCMGDGAAFMRGPALWKRQLESQKNESEGILRDGNWEVVYPAQRLTMDVQDRPALGRVMRALVSKKDLSLSDEAEYALSIPFEYRYGSALSRMPEAFRVMYTTTDFNDSHALRILASSLKPDQYRVPGKYVFPFSRLSATQRKLLEYRLYQARTSEFRVVQKDGEVSRGGGNTIWSEATLAFPDGLPSGCNMVIEVKQAPVVCTGSQEVGGLFRVDLDQVVRHFKTKDTDQGKMDPILAKDGLKAGDATSVTIKLELNEKVFLQDLVNHTAIRPGKTFTPETIPADIMELVNKRLKADGG